MTLDLRRPKTRGRWWWIDRWRRSSAFIDMTLAEQGAYHNLLDEQRLRGGLIPNDDRLLSKACGDPLEWPNIKDKLLRWFVPTEDGKHIYNLTATEVNATTDAISEAHSVGGKARASTSKGRSAGRFTSGPPATPPAAGPASQPAGTPAAHQPPLSVVRSPLSVSGSVSGTNERPTGHPAEEPQPTPATPSEARQKALAVLGEPCRHPVLVGKRIPPGKLLACPDCGAEFRGSSADGAGPKPNPFVQAEGRDKWESEAMRLVREIAALTGEDGAEIMARAARYEGAPPGRQKVNPAGMGEDRLVNTVLDLRATLKAEVEKRDKGAA